MRASITDIYQREHTLPGPYESTAQIIEANRDAGQFFFSPDTMRFFKSKVQPVVVAGRLFITSEQFDDDSPRQYKVRVAADNGHVSNLTDDTFTSARAACDFARQQVEESNAPQRA